MGQGTVWCGIVVQAKEGSGAGSCVVWYNSIGKGGSRTGFWCGIQWPPSPEVTPLMKPWFQRTNSL